MPTVAIIGSAGRRDDKFKVTRSLYDRVTARMNAYIANLTGPITLVSGGAAFMDHVAVRLYLEDRAHSLVLHLPAQFDHSRFIPKSKDFRDPGKISNYYHEAFSRKIRVSSLRELQQAIDKGAEIHIHNGFWARNKQVGTVDHLLAGTFGTRTSFNTVKEFGWGQSATAGLKDGGTAHTWRNSQAAYKLHLNLHEV